MVRNADKEITNISKRIDELTIQNNVALDSINNIKNNNIELEREVGGFRFVADAFGVPLNQVVKFFIFVIVLVFDPLAVALIIAFNGLLMKRKEEGIDIIIDDGGISDILKKEKEYEVYGDKKKQREAIIEMMKGDEELGLYDEPILASEKDAEVFFNEIENPSEPNEELKQAAEQYKADLKKKETDSDTKDLEENEITDDELLNLQTDYSPRPIDLDGDGSIDGIDTDGDGMIDKVIAQHPNRAMEVKNILPYYARANFDWNDRRNWINDQNAVNYWIKHIKPSQYPTDFTSKSY